MTNQEFLNTLGQMLAPIYAHFEQLDNNVTSLTNAFETLEHRFDVFENKFDTMEHRFDVFENKFNAMEHRFDVLENKFNALECRIASLEDNVNVLSNKIQHLEIQFKQLDSTMTNYGVKVDYEIMPVLNELSSCYLSTYQRYLTRTEQIDTMQTDIDALKSIVSEHSRQLACIG